jgi:hypothetical protein
LQRSLTKNRLLGFQKVIKTQLTLSKCGHKHGSISQEIHATSK